MENSASTVLVSEVARDVLSDIAPQEMPIFAAASRAYFADPAAALQQFRSKDDVLGFGMEAVTVLVTPAVLLVVSDVLDFLTRVAKKATEDGLAKEIPEIIKAMFRKCPAGCKEAAPSGRKGPVPGERGHGSTRSAEGVTPACPKREHRLSAGRV
jgi:hypothetical protein